MIFSTFQNYAYGEKNSKDNKHNSLRLARNYINGIILSTGLIM